MNDILSRIKRGTGTKAFRYVIAGPEGVGKSTIGSKAPKPLFIAAEDGLTGLDHVQRFAPTGNDKVNPPTTALDDLHSLLDSLMIECPFETLVFDTTDWLERLIAQSVCKRDGKSDIEDYGYGKGYVILEGELVKILQKLDTLRHDKGVSIVLLSHVQIKNFVDPRGTAYDRYEMKGHKRFTGILREWPDACLFCVFEVHKMKKKGEQRETAIGGDRVMHTEWSPAWDAKNRLNLPPELPMEWDALQIAISDNSSEALRAKVVALHKTAKFADAKAKETWDKAIKALESFTADRLKVAIEKLTALQPVATPAS